MLFSFLLMNIFCSERNEKKTDLLTYCIKIALTQLETKNLKKLMWPLPGMHINTSEHCCFWTYLKRFGNLIKKLILTKICYPGYFVMYFKNLSSNHQI